MARSTIAEAEDLRVIGALAVLVHASIQGYLISLVINEQHRRRLVSEGFDEFAEILDMPMMLKRGEKERLRPSSVPERECRPQFVNLCDGRIMCSMPGAAEVGANVEILCEAVFVLVGEIQRGARNHSDTPESIVMRSGCH